MRFSINDQVKVNTAGLSVRTDPPELAYIDSVSYGTEGTIIDGPFYGVPKGKPGFWHFWKVDYGSIVGWSAQDYLEKVTIQPPSSPTPLSPGFDSPPGEEIDILIPTFTWSSVGNADYYKLYISKYPYGSTNIIYSNENIQGTSLVLPSGYLQNGEKYRWDITACNSAGCSSPSYDMYFKVNIIQLPQVTTSPPSGIGTSSATLNGNLDSTGGETCQVWFEYGLTTSYGYSTSKQSKSSTGSFSKQISGLQSSKTYHFRACASNSKGTVCGSDRSFTTGSEIPTPVITGINPPQPIANPTRQWITILGTGFVSDSKVTLSIGSSTYPIPSDRTEYISSTQIKVFVGLTAPGTWSAQVTNPGNRLSNIFSFTVKPAQQTGSIIVNTNLDQATFTITGPQTYSGSGKSWSVSDAPTGTYTITYGDVNGYITPSSEAKTLSVGASITFSGAYNPSGTEDPFNYQGGYVLDETKLRGEEKAALPYVQKYANEYHISPALIMAIIRQESNFNPDAISSADAVGYMQVTYPAAYDGGYRGTEEQWLTNGLDPETNIKYGTKYLKILYGRFGDSSVYNGPLKNIISSYYSGHPTKDSEWYVNQVIAGRDIFDGQRRGYNFFLTIRLFNGGLAGKKICIDPGHGGSQPGAEGFGLLEKDVNLDVALRLRDLLVADGAIPIMTRTTDIYVSPEDRTNIANNNLCDRFVSIHCNGYSDSSVQGTETFWAKPNPYPDKSLDMANKINPKVVSYLSTKNRGVKEDIYSGPGSLYVLRNTNMPAILVELAFITNPDDNAKLKDSHYRQEAARAILHGLQTHYGETPHDPSLDQPPICSIELREQDTTNPINEINVDEFFDIYVGDSWDDNAIEWVRFSSDEFQDDIPQGAWTSWYDWDVSSSDWTGIWDAIRKVKTWAFATPGIKEVWAEVKDGTEQTAQCSADIYANPECTSGPCCDIATGIFKPAGTDCGICAECNGAGSCVADLTQDADCPLCQECSSLFTCSYQSEGNDIKAECPADACKYGYCDGAGSCAVKPARTSCGTCKECDGNGNCIIVELEGDVNDNKVVDIFDLAAVGLCYGQSATGDCQKADVTGDGKIDIFDLATVGLNYGGTC